MRKVAVSNFFHHKKKRNRAHRQLEVGNKVFLNFQFKKTKIKKQNKRRQVLLNIEINKKKQSKQRRADWRLK